MIPAEKIIVALDTSDRSRFISILNQLQGRDVWVKIGMEVFYSLGRNAIDESKARGFKVFLDLKLHDIPNTTSQGVNSLLDLQIDMLNIHAAGGLEMMKRCMEVMHRRNNPPILIAVTQLTSTTNEQMNLEQGIPDSLEDSVLRYARLTKEAGLAGVVCSPLEVKPIKQNFGQNFLTITPGIRPKDAASNDQKRITTPSEAFQMGTDYMVIGRPITEAPDPVLALQKILKGS